MSRSRWATSTRRSRLVQPVKLDCARPHGGGMAFVDELGNQFLALARDAAPHEDRERHLGLVVDDKAAVREALEAAVLER